MQTHLTARSNLQHPQPAHARQVLTAPRGERIAEESARPLPDNLEPHWAQAIDAATD